MGQRGGGWGGGVFACSVQRDGRCRGGGTCWHCSVRGVLASLGSVPVSFFSFSTWRLWMSAGRRPAAAGASPARPLSRGTPACRAAHPLRARRYGGGPAAGAARGAAPRGVAATPRRSRGGGGGEPRRRGRMAGALGCWQRVGAAQGDRGGGGGGGAASCARHPLVVLVVAKRERGGGRDGQPPSTALP